MNARIPTEKKEKEKRSRFKEFFVRWPNQKIYCLYHVLKAFSRKKKTKTSLYITNAENTNFLDLQLIFPWNFVIFHTFCIQPIGHSLNFFFTLSSGFSIDL